MPNQSADDMRPLRRNAVSEIPFAGRIGGFQQEIADDEKNRELLKNQPDAVSRNSNNDFIKSLN
jgi:hypothetical protein